MQAFKDQITDLRLLDVTANVYTATYQSQRVVIKPIANYQRRFHTKAWLNKTLPNEILIYQAMSQIPQLAAIVPKLVLVLTNDLADFDKDWLMSKLTPEDYQHHAYLIIEYVQGKLISETFDYPAEIQERIKSNTIAALELLHQYNILHGDLHSDNILVRADHTVCFIDFEYTSIEKYNVRSFVRLYQRSIYNN